MDFSCKNSQCVIVDSFLIDGAQTLTHPETLRPVLPAIPFHKPIPSLLREHPGHKDRDIGILLSFTAVWVVNILHSLPLFSSTCPYETPEQVGDSDCQQIATWNYSMSCSTVSTCNAVKRVTLTKVVRWHRMAVHHTYCMPCDTCNSHLVAVALVNTVEALEKHAAMHPKPVA